MTVRLEIEGDDGLPEYTHRVVIEVPSAEAAGAIIGEIGRVHALNMRSAFTQWGPLHSYIEEISKE